MMKSFFALVFLGLSSISHAHPTHPAPPSTPSHDGHLVFDGGSLHAHLVWDQGPDAEGGESILRLEWHDGRTHAPVEPGRPLEVSLWMPSMGHGSAPTQVQRSIDSSGQVELGVYVIRNLYFLMSGDWEVRFAVTHPDGQIETQVWSIYLEGDDHNHDHNHNHGPHHH
jgi:hypothetical protein